MSAGLELSYEGENLIRDRGGQASGAGGARFRALGECLLRTAAAIAGRRGLDFRGSRVRVWGEEASCRAELVSGPRLVLEAPDRNRVLNALKACALRRELKAEVWLEAGGERFPVG